MIALTIPKPFQQIRLNRGGYQRKERFVELCEELSAPLVTLSRIDSSSWTVEKDRRRCALIDKSLQANLTIGEQRELSELQRQAEAHFDEVAPPPIEGALRLHAQLLKLANAKNQ